MTFANYSPAVLRLKEVLELTGLSRSTIYAEIKAHRFPRQVNLTSRRCVGWSSEEVRAWIDARLKSAKFARIEGEV